MNEPRTALPRHFWSQDGRFGCALDEVQLQRMLRFSFKAGPNETGGILIGYYDEDFRLATVTVASGPPGGSKAGPTWFERGTKGLASWLDRLWSSQRFYLGEWHYHPSASPIPSGTDKAMMAKISASANFCCPEPLLIIVGGRPTVDPSLGVYVYPDKRDKVELVLGYDGAGPIELSNHSPSLAIIPSYY